MELPRSEHRVARGVRVRAAVVVEQLGVGGHSGAHRRSFIWDSSAAVRNGACDVSYVAASCVQHIAGCYLCGFV